MDGQFSRRFDTDPHFVPVDIDDRDHDVVADEDFLSELSGKY